MPTKEEPKAVAESTPATTNAPDETAVKNVAESQTKEESTDATDVETLIPRDSYQTDPTFYAVADYFNIAPEDYPVAKDYLSEIVDFVIRDTQSNDSSEILAKIREIENKVQPPQWGEKRYWNIRKYIRLATKKNSIEKAMSAFEKEDKKNG